MGSVLTGLGALIAALAGILLAIARTGRHRPAARRGPAHPAGDAWRQATLAGHPAGTARIAPPVRPSGRVRVRSHLLFSRRTPRAFVLDAVLVDIEGTGSPDSLAGPAGGRVGATDDATVDDPALDGAVTDDTATAVAGRLASGLPFTVTLRPPGTDWMATRVEKAFTEWTEGGDLVTIDLTARKGRPRATVASRGWAVRLDLAGTSGLPVTSR